MERNLNRILIIKVIGVERMMLVEIVVNFLESIMELIYFCNLVMRNNSIKYMGFFWF